MPVENQILFGYLGSGDDLHLAIPGPDYDQIQVRVPHFSGFGLGSGIGTDRATLLLKRAADHEARLQQQVGEYLARERQAQLLGTEGGSLSGLADYMESYYGLVVRPRLLAASSSCANATLAIRTLLGLERQRQLLGIASDSPGGHIDEIVAPMNAAYTTRREEAIRECKAKVDPSVLIAFELGVERQKQLLGVSEGTSVPDLVEESVRICGAAFDVSGQGGAMAITGRICRLDQPFELDIRSTGATGRMEFTPTSLLAGTFVDEASGDGFMQSGQGTYEVTGLEASPVMVGAGEGCVSGSGFENCGAYSFEAQLTLIKAGC